MHTLIRTAASAWTCLAVAAASAASAQPEPITYALSFPDPASHTARVEMTFPTDGADAVELMMPVWSPGFYRVENYAEKVTSLTAVAPSGVPLTVDKPRANRWRVAAGGGPRVTVTYTLTCEGRFVTTNWVGPDAMVLNGPATFITPVQALAAARDVRITLPPPWPRVATSLPPAPGGDPLHYTAPDYDTLVDAPIIAGALEVHDFEVGGVRHALVDLGAGEGWDGREAAARIQAVVQQNLSLWGSLPFREYLFLNVFRPGGGGLEHRDSTLLTASTTRAPKPSLGWLKFVSHEYFHAFNVKRLRPVELGPFDYEKPPTTSNLWIAEGWTTYYGDLLVDRSPLGSPEDFLDGMSGHIREVQTTPGRLVQTLADASAKVWTSSTSGVGGNKDTTVSYYAKGAVAAFLLDAKIRRASRNARSLDDVIRLTYARYSGAKGYTTAEFEAAASEAAGIDLAAWFADVVRSTKELDYTEMLDWYGLQFTPPAEGREPDWKLLPRPDATDEQKHNLRRLLGRE
jgi:predicted metalloprotease with PDZ domain